MKEIFVKEAECIGIMTLEHGLSLPVGVEYIHILFQTAHAY